MKKTLLTASVLLLSFPAFSSPQINIGGMYDYLDSEKSTLIKKIQNAGTSTAFVKVEVSEIDYQPDGNSREVALNTEQLLNGQGRGLVASPARLIVPVKGQQNSRIIFIGERDKERYYRVRYIPVIPKKASEFGQSEVEFDKQKKTLTAGVTMLTGYGAIVTVRPQKATYDTRMQKQGQDYVITNNGNSTVIAEDVQACESGFNSCRESQTMNILPGSTKKIPLISGKSYKFKLIEGKEKKNVRFSN